MSIGDGLARACGLRHKNGGRRVARGAGGGRRREDLTGCRGLARARALTAVVAIGDGWLLGLAREAAI